MHQPFELSVSIHEPEESCVHIDLVFQWFFVLRLTALNIALIEVLNKLQELCKIAFVITAHVSPLYKR